jgi:hypothetical protein
MDAWEIQTSLSRSSDARANAKSTSPVVLGRVDQQIPARDTSTPFTMCAAGTTSPSRQEPSGGGPAHVAVIDLAERDALVAHRLEQFDGIAVSP